MTRFFKTTAFLLAATIGMLSCSSDSDSGGGGNEDDGQTGVTPTNLQVSAQIAGADAAHPNGDGSGMVTFTATAQNAISYSFTFPDGTMETSTSGVLEKQFTSIGVNTYAIAVKAFGTGNTSANSGVGVSVLYEPELVWSEEFDIDGSVNASNWTHELGNNGGWGNNEAQTYTNSMDNSKVENGMLKITLKKVGTDYTSARLKSENKFEFTYGKIEVRAKLPSGGGTWPAIWMLGENYATAAWPSCGEIDIMEHVGNQQNTIHGTLHYPGNSGGNANTGHTTVSTASTDFHVYSCTWTAQSIKFAVDGTVFHQISNSASLPFNHDFFFILNVAMGGNFGGTIDPTFTESSMEVDYVRVYQ